MSFADKFNLFNEFTYVAELGWLDGPSGLVRGRAAAASSQLRVACARIATSAGRCRLC